MRARFINESILDILVPKTKEEIEKNIPKEYLDLIKLCYDAILQSNKYAITRELGLNRAENGFNYYGFTFMNLKNKKIYYIVEYNNEDDEYLERGILLTKYDDGYTQTIIKSPIEFMFMLDLFKRIHESVDDIFKPKSKEEVEKAFENMHPDFVKLAKIFVNGEYEVEIKGENPPRVESSFAFSIKDDQKEYIFLVNQSPYFKEQPPTISYLNKRLASHGFGGAFVISQPVRTEEHVNNYIKRIINIYK